MPISPHLLRKLQEALGAEAADEVVNLMEGMDANRGDLGELRHEMQLGFTRIDARVEKVQAEMKAAIEMGLREQTRFFFLAWSALLAAVIGLYAR